MRNLLALVITFMIGLSASAQKDPVIMTINGKEVTKSEFLQIYLKNNKDPKYDKASLDEYMLLFKKFKLKVAEAEDMGYDTIPSLVKELDGYRKQLALPYLVDTKKNTALIVEAYERTKTEVHASHILLKLSPNSSPDDTLAVYNRMMEIKKRIEGGEDFATVAKSKGGSEDPSAQTNNGDLGFFTAFQMVYPFEEAAYTTPEGQLSNPFRTRFGYHILKVEGKRPARGTIHSAHIMIAVTPTSDDVSIEAANKKINEIYDLLESGEDFVALANKFSDDPTTSKKGGVLPVFGTGSSTRMVPEFEEVAFSLKNDGDFSKPIRTNFGIHIIKRLSWSDVAPFEDLEKELKVKVAKDERAKQTQDSFVANVKKEYGYKNETLNGLKWFYENIDTTYILGKFNSSSLKTNDVLFTLDGVSNGQKGFAEFLVSTYRKVNRSSTPAQIIDNQYKLWEKQTILDYEESKLEGKYPAFKALITEYHDGILLYEVMSDEVWNKAMRDTVGLKEFYETNKSNYQWGNRLDVDIFECHTQEHAKEAYAILKADTSDASQIVKSINKDSELNVRYRDGKYDTSKTPYLKDKKLKKGLNKVYEYDGKFFAVYVNEILKPAQKEFSEAKGAITSDYQTYLEKNWLLELEKKHKIVVNEEALYSIGN